MAVGVFGLLLVAFIAGISGQEEAPGLTAGRERAEAQVSVRDANTNIRISGAVVQIVGSSKADTTGADGDALISGLGIGKHVISVERPGYGRQKQEVSVGTEKEKYEVTVRLEPANARRSGAGNGGSLTLDQSSGNVRSNAQTQGVSTRFGGGAPLKRDRGYPGSEDYNRIETNDFVSPRDKPLSTFSVDVDGASYSNVRRFIKSGGEPPKDAVRVEEMLNYFEYDYEVPNSASKHPFSTTIEGGETPWAKGHKLLHIGLQTRPIEKENRPPTNLVFLVDVSGSMRTPRKLPLLKYAFEKLTEELRPKDRVAMVAYAGSSGLVLESTSGSEKGRIKEKISSLEAGGSTAGASGIRLAYEVAQQNFLEEGNNRVVLATDGDFNVGVASEGELVRLIEKKRKSGVYLSILGFGTGNLKDSKMEQIANHGNGNYFYIDGRPEAEKVLVDQVGSTLQTVAKDVKIQLEFNPSRVLGYRLIGYSNRKLEPEEFADDEKDAGEVGAGHSVTALYEIIPQGASTYVDLEESPDLEYQNRTTEESDDWLTASVRYKRPDADTSRLFTETVTGREMEALPRTENFYFSSAVAGFGLILRDSKYKRDLSHEMVLSLAKKGTSEGMSTYKAGFLNLVREHRARIDTSGNPIEE